MYLAIVNPKLNQKGKIVIFAKATQNLFREMVYHQCKQK